MNKRFACFLFLLLTPIFPSAMAAEVLSFQAPALTQQTSSEKAPFSMTVTPDGQLVTKPGSIFTSGGDYTDITLPYLLSAPKPIRYPAWAVREGWQGDLVLAIEVLTDGSVGRYAVAKSTGHVRLDRAVIAAVKTWKFQPSTKNGKPIVECAELPVHFEIQS